MNYAFKKVEILTLLLKYPAIFKNLFQMTFVTCSDLIQGGPMQPEDHEMRPNKVFKLPVCHPVSGCLVGMGHDT